MEIETLILKLKNGDKGAWKVFVELYGKRILNYIYGFIKQKQTAEELTQEVFLRVYRNIEKIEPKKEFLESYIFKVAKNISIDHWRKEKKKKLMYEGTFFESSEPEYELKDIVWKAMDMLSDDLRSILILREFDGYSYEEISQIEKIPVGTVKSKLNRAKIKLAEAVKSLQRRN